MKRLGATLVLMGLTVGPAAALTDEEIFRDFRFNLINPGARSLALGGAFISLADDATAARANPAGLSYLLKTEYFLELRVVDNGGTARDFQNPLSAGGTVQVLSGSGVRDVQSLTFASAVFPVEKVTFGISRQEVLNTQSSTLNSFSFDFGSSSGSGTSGVSEGTGSIDVLQVNWNASVGFRVSDRFAFGASVTYAQLRVTSEVENFIYDPGGNFDPTGQFYDAQGNSTGNRILEPTLDLRTTIRDGDQDLGLSIGAIYRPSQAFSFGAVYRHAPKFNVVERIDPGIDSNGDGHIDQGIDVFHVRDRLGTAFDNRFPIPDAYGIGASWRPYSFLTLALDVERTEYSDLVRGYVGGVNVLTGFDARFTAKDAVDFRLGGEYVFLLKQRFPLALRAGVYSRSDNTVHAVSTGTKDSFATPSAFPGRAREYHGALGLGIGAGRQTVDMAVDLGDVDNQFVVSYIFQGR